MFQSPPTSYMRFIRGYHQVNSPLPYSLHLILVVFLQGPSLIHLLHLRVMLKTIPIFQSKKSLKHQTSASISMKSRPVPSLSIAFP